MPGHRYRARSAFVAACVACSLTDCRDAPATPAPPLRLLTMTPPAGVDRRPARPGPTQDELNDADRDASNWLYATHDYSGRRFVALSQINRANVDRLRPVCVYQTHELGNTQTSPLAYRGVLYLTTAHATIALDGASCRPVWVHTWAPRGFEPGLTNRGAAIKDGAVIRTTPDGYLLALDQASGQLLWSRQVADPRAGEIVVAPPLLYEDLILIGAAASELASNGWAAAFRLADGAPVWRFSTIPRPGEPGAETWSTTAALAHGGGAIWTPMAFDRDRELLYLPTSNPTPDFFDDARAGANLYTNSLVALNVRTGKLAWYFQAVPHDVHDYDLTQVSPLFRTRTAGRLREVVTLAGKDGLLRVVDRQSHELLWSTELTTRLNQDAAVTVEGVRVCPGSHAGVLWNGPAYDPTNDLLVVAAVDHCATVWKDATRPRLPRERGDLYFGGRARGDPLDPPRGSLTALDATTGGVRWRYASPTPLLAGVTVTSGGLVFTGDLAHDLLALDTRTGRVRYRFNTGAPIGTSVVTYSAQGRQYVAVVSGYVSPQSEGFGALGGGSATVLVFGLPAPPR